MSQTAALFALQTLDSQIDAIRQRLNEVADLLSEDAEVRAAQSSLMQAEQSSASWRIRQTTIEHERERLQQEAKATEERLYSGQVFNPRELADLQDKLTELNHHRESLEEPVLEAMLALEEGDKVVELRRAQLERVLGEKEHRLVALGEEQVKLTVRLQALEGEAVEARAQVKPAHLDLYDRLRQKSGGVAVTAIHGAECGVCGVELTSLIVQRVRHDEILPCPTCGRILHI